MKLSWNPQATGPCGWMFQSGEALEVCYTAAAAPFFDLYVHTLKLLILFNGEKNAALTQSCANWQLDTESTFKCSRQGSENYFSERGNALGNQTLSPPSFFLSFFLIERLLRAGGNLSAD